MELIESQKIYVEEVKSAIIQGDASKIDDLTNKVIPNIFLWDYDIFNEIFSTLLNIAVNLAPSVSKITIFKNILNNFDAKEDWCPIYSRIWFLSRIRESTLIFMRNELPYSFSTYFIDLATFETYPQDKRSVISIDQSINRLFKIFGVPDTNDLIDLNNFISSKIISGTFINQVAISHIQIQLMNSGTAKLEDIAPKPEYIEDFGYGSVSEQAEGTENELDLEGATELLQETELLGPEGYEVARKIAMEIVDEDKETNDGTMIMNLRSFVYHNTIIKMPKELYDLLQGQEEYSCIDPKTMVKFDPDNIDEREELATYFFQIFGPINPFGDIEYGYDEKNIHNRMFVCVAYENALNDDRGEFDETEAVDSLSWFTSVCEYCSKKILRYWYAVRAPVVPGGGFVGTFCSWDHVRKSDTSGSLEFLSYVNELERQCKEVGIHDRE